MKQKQINRRRFLKATAALSAGSFWISCAETTSEREGPNILCITCEDIGAYLACFGDEVAWTPNLDQLASEGVKFTNLFSCSGVCAPSRFALITGMYPSACGANNMRTSSHLPAGIPAYEAVPPPGVRCVSEYFRAKGYYCTNNAKTDYQFSAPITAWDECGRKAHWKNRPKGMPFFSVFNLTATHESQVWDRANDPVTIRPQDVKVPPYYPDTYTIRRDIARVYNNITIMDRQVGELVVEIKNAGLLYNTIVIFYSDHGGPLPRGKRELYDSGLNAPMIIRFPNQQYAGMQVDGLISFVDIPPTLLSLAGIAPPDHMHGRAFWGQYKARPRNYIFAARDRLDSQYDVRRAVRDHRFKYIRNYHPEIGCYQDIAFRKKLSCMQELLRMRDNGQLNEDQLYWFRERKAPEELYDLANDPYELDNLAGNPDFRQHLLRLRSVHQKWLADIGDHPLQSEKEKVWSMWPGGVQPKTDKPQIHPKGQIIQLFCPTEGALIAYQINGKGYRKDHWFLYRCPFGVDRGDEITATAIRIGYRQSETVSWIYE